MVQCLKYNVGFSVFALLCFIITLDSLFAKQNDIWKQWFNIWKPEWYKENLCTALD